MIDLRVVRERGSAQMNTAMHTARSSNPVAASAVLEKSHSNLLMRNMVLFLESVS